MSTTEPTLKAILAELLDRVESVLTVNALSTDARYLAVIAEIRAELVIAAASPIAPPEKLQDLTERHDYAFQEADRAAKALQKYLEDYYRSHFNDSAGSFGRNQDQNRES